MALTGTLARVAAAEILFAAVEGGMRTLKMDGMEKVLMGLRFENGQVGLHQAVFRPGLVAEFAEAGDCASLGAWLPISLGTLAQNRHPVQLSLTTT